MEELTSSVEQVAEHAQSQASAVEQGTASMSQVRQLVDGHNLLPFGCLGNEMYSNRSWRHMGAEEFMSA